jgi:hypothetical protein
MSINRAWTTLKVKADFSSVVLNDLKPKESGIFLSKLLSPRGEQFLPEL